METVYVWVIHLVLLVELVVIIALLTRARRESLPRHAVVEVVPKPGNETSPL